MSASTPAEPWSVKFSNHCCCVRLFVLLTCHVIIWTQVSIPLVLIAVCSEHWLVSSSGNVFEHLSQKWVRS